jgi:hypothetical protein
MVGISSKASWIDFSSRFSPPKTIWRAVDHLNGVLQDTTDHQLGPTERAAALGQGAGNGGGVRDRQKVARVLAIDLKINVPLPFGNVFVALQKYHRHGCFSSGRPARISYGLAFYFSRTPMPERLAWNVPNASIPSRLMGLI